MNRSGDSSGAQGCTFARAIGVGGGLACLAWAVRTAVEPHLPLRVPYLFFVFAVGIGVRYAGRAAGTVSAVIGLAIGAVLLNGFSPWSERFVPDMAVTLVYAAVSLGIILFLGALRDAQERLLRERRAREHEERRFSAILESIADAVIAVDQAESVTYMNPAAERLTGWPREAALRQPLGVVYQVAAAPEGGGATVLTPRVGEPVPIQTATTPLQGAGADLAGAAIVVFRDATAERENARVLDNLNRDLRRRVVELETLLRVLPIGIGIADDPACRDIRANPALSEMLAVAEAANASLTAPDVERPTAFVVRHAGRDLRGDELPMQVAAATGREVSEFEEDIVRADGATLHILAYAAPLCDEFGAIRGSVGAFVDITERKKMEEGLRANQAAIEDLNVRLHRAMYETHHRVKNNLQVINALIDMQAMRDEPTIPMAEFRRLGQHVGALAVIHDLLTHSAKAEREVDVLRVRDTLLRLMPIVQGMVGDRVLRFDVADIEVPIRQGTALAVLVNELISNAVKHGGGAIELSLRVADGEAQLVVCDEGPGFRPDFDAAVEAHTGLELIENLSRWDLSGRVEYSNREGGGAAVRVRFPCDGVAKRSESPDNQ